MIETGSPLIELAFHSRQTRSQRLQFCHQLLASLFECPGSFLGGLRLTPGRLENLVVAGHGFGVDSLGFHPRGSHHVLGFATARRRKPMSLPFSLAEHAQRVPFGCLDDSPRLMLSLAKQFLGRMPGVGSKVLGVFAGGSAFSLSLGHCLGSPSGRIGGSPFSHPLGGRPGRLQYLRHLFPDGYEFGSQIALGELSQPAGQAIALGQKIAKLLSDPAQKLVNFGRVDTSKCLTEAPAGYFFRRQLIHGQVQDTFLARPRLAFRRWVEPAPGEQLRWGR